MAKKVNDSDLFYAKNCKKFQLADDLDDGQEAMVAKSTTYLPKEPKEKPIAYNVRLNRTPFYPGFSDCLDYLTGAVFRRDAMLGDDASAQQKEFAENVDLQGNNLSVFARRVFRNAEKHSISYIFVDFPTLPDGLSLGDERRLNARPYWREIPASSLFFLHTGIIGGQELPLEIRFFENTVMTDNYEQKQQCTIRRYLQLIQNGEPAGVQWETWIQDEKDQDKYIISASGMMEPIKKIPIVPVYTEQAGFMRGRWRLEHCARLNVTHWQSSSDQRNILRVTRCPILAHAGFFSDPDSEIEISPNSHQVTTKAEGKMWWVEHSGAAIGAGQTDLDNLERQMAQIGKSITLRKTGTITATESSINTAQGQSELQAHSKSLKDALENCFIINAAWTKSGDKPCTVIVNTEYGIMEADASNNGILLTSVQAGKLSLLTYLSELKRRNLLAETVVVADEIERIKIEQASNWLSGDNEGSEE